jgi:hypothetical protein
MATNESVPVIQHAIQLAIAPVFLLTGIASLLGVMANRLSRIVDRARDLEQRWAQISEAVLPMAKLEVATLERRRHLASWSINFCTGAALLVCVVIATLFFEEFFAKDLKWLAGSLFIGVMVALVAGLSCFFARGLSSDPHGAHRPGAICAVIISPLRRQSTSFQASCRESSGTGSQLTGL